VTRVVPKLLVAAALVAVALPASAFASAQEAADDCTADGTLSRTYTDRELRGAIGKLETDDLEYGDCAQILRGAIGAGAGKDRSSGSSPGSSGGGGNSGTLSGEEQSAQQTDQQALAALTSKPGSDSIDVGGKHVEPGENGVFDLASAENGVPKPLLALLIGLGVVALGGAPLLLRRRMPALARLSTPLKRIPLARGLGRARFRR
jgi:hypothetical protein